jgi:hypothetical protein
MSWMTPKGSTKVLHTQTKRREWLHSSYGKTSVTKTRSYANRAMIFAITTGISAPRPTYGTAGAAIKPGEISWPRWISVKLHSMQTWRYANPMDADASTQFNLSREDAEFLVIGLLAAITEFDKQEAADLATTITATMGEPEPA